MPPSRYAGSVSRPGSHGNGLHLAEGPTSCDLFCSAGGGFWPITSNSQFGPGPLLVEPDMTGRTYLRPSATESPPLIAPRSPTVLPSLTPQWPVLSHCDDPRSVEFARPSFQFFVSVTHLPTASCTVRVAVGG